MVWHALLQSANATLPALIPTTVDRIVAWGALALMIGVIAWREYTLPDVSPTPALPPEVDAERPASTVPDAPPQAREATPAV